MALEILKLAINATTNVLTTPDVQKFFYVVDTEIIGDETGETKLTILASQFIDGHGITGVTLPEVSTDNGYLSVYVNGVLLMQDLIEYNPGGADTGSLVISVPDGSSINAKSPVVLVVTNFTSTAETTINT